MNLHYCCLDELVCNNLLNVFMMSTSLINSCTKSIFIQSRHTVHVCVNFPICLEAGDRKSEIDWLVIVYTVVSVLYNVTMVMSAYCQYDTRGSDNTWDHLMTTTCSPASKYFHNRPHHQLTRNLNQE